MNKETGDSIDSKFLSSLKELRSLKKYQNFETGSVQVDNPVDLQKRRKQILGKIEDLVLKVVNSTDELTLMLRPRRSQWNNCCFSKRLTLKERYEPSVVEINYATHKHRFEILFYLLEKIYRLIQTQSSMTKREIYYEQTAMFGSQIAVNNGLNDVCTLLSASPWELRVLSSSKGLVAGALCLTTADRQVINCNKPGGVLVPQDVMGIRKITSSATFILVVEKDAAFQKLLDDGIHLKYGPCILVTGKGEPDINTRLLLHRLTRELPVPVLILVDANPYGIEIMCTYRFGSLSLCEYSEHLAAEEALWLGVHPTDISHLSVPSVPMTSHDIIKAHSLTRRPYVRNNQQLLDQITCLLEGGRKCEIENLTSLSSKFLTDMFISCKVTSRELI